jgi:hypothetical protein
VLVSAAVAAGAPPPTAVTPQLVDAAIRPRSSEARMPVKIAVTNSGRQRLSACVRIVWISEGRRHIKTCRTKKEADSFLVHARHEIVRGVHTPESTSITIAEAARVWLEKGELEHLERSTLRQYSIHVKLHISTRGSVR